MSATVKFYGESDDLIEVDGIDATVMGCDEYPSTDATFVVTCDDASMCFVRVRYEDPGTWSVAMWPIDEGAAMPRAEIGMVGAYSAILTIAGVRAVVKRADS